MQLDGRFIEKSSPIAEYALGLRNSDNRSFNFFAFATPLIVFTDVPQFNKASQQVLSQKPIS